MQSWDAVGLVPGREREGIKLSVIGKNNFGGWMGMIPIPDLPMGMDSQSNR